MSYITPFKAKINNQNHSHYGAWGEARFLSSTDRSDLYKIVLEDGDELVVSDEDIRRSFLDNTDAAGVMTFCFGPLAFRVKDFFGSDAHKSERLINGESQWTPLARGLYCRRD